MRFTQSAKAALIALLYTRYHFATKNYYISANLQAKYSHRAIIARTLTDFTGSTIGNEELRKSIYETASTTLFSDIDKGYVKAITEQQVNTPFSRRSTYGVSTHPPPCSIDYFFLKSRKT
jgi:hypothetical protein